MNEGGTNILASCQQVKVVQNWSELHGRAYATSVGSTLCGCVIQHGVNLGQGFHIGRKKLDLSQ